MIILRVSGSRVVTDGPGLVGLETLEQPIRQNSWNGIEGGTHFFGFPSRDGSLPSTNTDQVISTANQYLKLSTGDLELSRNC